MISDVQLAALSNWLGSFGMALIVVYHVSRSGWWSRTAAGVGHAFFGGVLRVQRSADERASDPVLAYLPAFPTSAFCRQRSSRRRHRRRHHHTASADGECSTLGKRGSAGTCQHETYGPRRPSPGQTLSARYSLNARRNTMWCRMGLLHRQASSVLSRKISIPCII